MFYLYVFVVAILGLRLAKCGKWMKNCFERGQQLAQLNCTRFGCGRSSVQYWKHLNTISCRSRKWTTYNMEAHSDLTTFMGGFYMRFFVKELMIRPQYANQPSSIVKKWLRIANQPSIVPGCSKMFRSTLGTWGIHCFEHPAAQETTWGACCWEPATGSGAMPLALAGLSRAPGDAATISPEKYGGVLKGGNPQIIYLHWIFHEHVIFIISL